jgi:hypothetical protein
VIADEFGFMAAFLLPLLGISLVARATRREEESGRLELLLGGRIARHQPTLAALLVATATVGITGALFAAGLIGTGVPVAGSLLYAASLGSLAFVFAGVAALLAQLTLHARGVYTWSLIVLAASYLLRGVGDVTGTWITWLSPARLGGEGRAGRGPALVGGPGPPDRGRPGTRWLGATAGCRARPRQRSGPGQCRAGRAVLHRTLHRLPSP